MQTLIQVICSHGPSLRDRIVHDTRIERDQLVVSESKRMDRSRGWTKVHGLTDDAYGAINIQWLPAASTLLCRVVTRGKDPGPITGLFVAYLMTRHRARVDAIHVVPGV